MFRRLKSISKAAENDTKNKTNMYTLQRTAATQEGQDRWVWNNEEIESQYMAIWTTYNEAGDEDPTITLYRFPLPTFNIDDFKADLGIAEVPSTITAPKIHWIVKNPVEINGVQELADTYKFTFDGIQDTDYTIYSYNFMNDITIRANFILNSAKQPSFMYSDVVNNNPVVRIYDCDVYENKVMTERSQDPFTHYTLGTRDDPALYTQHLQLNRYYTSYDKMALKNDIYYTGIASRVYLACETSLDKSLYIESDSVTLTDFLRGNGTQTVRYYGVSNTNIDFNGTDLYSSAGKEFTGLQGSGYLEYGAENINFVIMISSQNKSFNDIRFKNCTFSSVDTRPYTDFIEFHRVKFYDRMEVTLNFIKTLKESVQFMQGLYVDYDTSTANFTLDQLEQDNFIITYGDFGKQNSDFATYIPINRNGSLMKSGIEYERIVLHDIDFKNPLDPNGLAPYDTSLNDADYLISVINDVNKASDYVTTYPNTASCRQWLCECQTKCTKGIIEVKINDEYISLATFASDLTNDVYPFNEETLRIVKTDTTSFIHDSIEPYDVDNTRNLRIMLSHDLLHGVESLDLPTDATRLDYTGQKLAQWIMECEFKAGSPILLTRNYSTYYTAPEYAQLCLSSNINLNTTSSPFPLLFKGFWNRETILKQINDYLRSYGEFSRNQPEFFKKIVNFYYESIVYLATYGRLINIERYPSTDPAIEYYATGSYGTGDNAITITNPRFRLLDTPYNLISTLSLTAEEATSMHENMDMYSATDDMKIEEVILKDLKSVERYIIISAQLTYKEEKEFTAYSNEAKKLWYQECSKKLDSAFNRKRVLRWTYLIDGNEYALADDIITDYRVDVDYIYKYINVIEKSKPTLEQAKAYINANYSGVNTDYVVVNNYIIKTISDEVYIIKKFVCLHEDMGPYLYTTNEDNELTDFARWVNYDTIDLRSQWMLECQAKLYQTDNRVYMLRCPRKIEVDNHVDYDYDTNYVRYYDLNEALKLFKNVIHEDDGETTYPVWEWFKNLTYDPFLTLNNCPLYNTNLSATNANEYLKELANNVKNFQYYSNNRALQYINDTMNAIHSITDNDFSVTTTNYWPIFRGTSRDEPSTTTTLSYNQMVKELYKSQSLLLDTYSFDVDLVNASQGMQFPLIPDPIRAQYGDDLSGIFDWYKNGREGYENSVEYYTKYAVRAFLIELFGTKFIYLENNVDIQFLYYFRNINPVVVDNFVYDWVPVFKFFNTIEEVSQAYLQTYELKRYEIPDRKIITTTDIDYLRNTKDYLMSIRNDLKGLVYIQLTLYMYTINNIQPIYVITNSFSISERKFIRDENNDKIRLPLAGFLYNIYIFNIFNVVSDEMLEMLEMLEFEEVVSENRPFFKTWEPETVKNHGYYFTETAATVALKDLIEKARSTAITQGEFRKYLDEWQYKCTYLSYEDGSVVFSEEPGANVTFKITTTDDKVYYIDDLLKMDSMEDFRSVKTVDAVEYMIDRGEPDGEVVTGYVLTDEDQNETDGWTYTNKIYTLIEDYFSDPEMSNNEVANIIALIATRLTTEVVKAEDDEKLKEIVDNVHAALDLIELMEQKYDREEVLDHYTDEEIDEIRDAFEEWRKYYTLTPEEYINRSTKMIWEEMYVDYFSDVDTVNPDMIVDYYNIIESTVNGKETKWTFDMDGDGSIDDEEKMQIMAFSDATDVEYVEMMEEIQGARNRMQRNDSNHKLIVVCGTNYGDLYSVFTKEDSTLPVETYFRIRHETSSGSGSSQTMRRLCPKPQDNSRDLIYIPVDRETSDTVWTQDQWLTTDLYQYIFYPMSYYINDSSPFKGLIKTNVDIRYLGYIIVKEEPEGATRN